MTLISQIKSNQLTARKNRNTVEAALLTTLIGELQTQAKNLGVAESTDEQVIATIKKFLKNINETLANTTDFDKNVELEIEKMVLNSYLPKQLDEDDLRVIINEMAEQNHNMGSAMKLLKAQFAGQYDGALASKLMKELL